MVRTIRMKTVCSFVFICSGIHDKRVEKLEH